MKRITVYTPEELKRKNPQAFEKAHSQYNYIDWERATRELQMDYTSGEFDGVTYWIR